MEPRQSGFVDPCKLHFTVREWLWGLFAFACFWVDKYHPKNGLYRGLAVRQALILMRLRGERPATLSELRALIGEPIIHASDSPLMGSVPFLTWDPRSRIFRVGFPDDIDAWENHRFLAVRRD